MRTKAEPADPHRSLCSEVIRGEMQAAYQHGHIPPPEQHRALSPSFEVEH
jgi:hypothetical protein